MKDRQMGNRVFTILLADDDAAARLYYHDELIEEKYEILMADNGLQVLGILEDKKVDLLVTDIRMPDMDALEMIPRVRKEHPYLPIIVVSIIQKAEDDLILKNSGVKAFFSKPVQMEDLKSKIRQILKV